MCVSVCVNWYMGSNSVTELWGVFSKPQSVTFQALDYVAYCYVYSLSLPALLIPAIATTQVHPPTWDSPVSVPSSPTSMRRIFPTWSSLVSVPAYRLPTQTSSPFPLRSYYKPISPPLLLLILASLEFSRVALTCFSVVYWCHHTFLLHPPPSYPVSLAHTSNKGRCATHCAMFACRYSMWILSDWVPAASHIHSDPGISHSPSRKCFALFPVIICRNSVYVPSILFEIDVKRNHFSDPCNIIACTTDL